MDVGQNADPLNRFGWSEITDGTSNTMMFVKMAGRPDKYNGRTYTGTTLPNYSAWVSMNAFSLTGWASDGTARGRCIVNCSNNTSVYSFHSGGANVCMADGSVQFITDSIQPEVFAALCIMAGGEVCQPRLTAAAQHPEKREPTWVLR